MSMGMGMGPAFRAMRTDRSAVSQRLARGTVRRVLSYAGAAVGKTISARA